MRFPTIEATLLEAMFEDRGNHMSTVKRDTVHYAQLFQKGHLSFGISSKGAVYKMPQCLMAGRVLQCICLQSLSFMIPNESNEYDFPCVRSPTFLCTERPGEHACPSLSSEITPTEFAVLRVQHNAHPCECGNESITSPRISLSHLNAEQCAMNHVL